MKNTLKYTCVAMVCSLAALAHAEGAPPYLEVTDARLQAPEPANWLLYRGNYGGWGYSPLKSINTDNVGKLTLAWSYATGVAEGHQAPPIVNGAYMYVATPSAQVIAFDARSGNEI